MVLGGWIPWKPDAGNIGLNLVISSPVNYPTEINVVWGNSQGGKRIHKLEKMAITDNAKKERSKNRMPGGLMPISLRSYTSGTSPK